MTGRAVCPGCGQGRQVTTAGLFRLHRRGGATCPGAGQEPPEGAAEGLQAPAAPRPGLTGPTAPAEPTYGRSCDGGRCDAPSVGWRLFRGWREWLPVCGLHMEGGAGRTRVYDRDLTGGGR